MNKVVMYSKDYCPYCARAKALLESAAWPTWKSSRSTAIRPSATS